MTESESQTQFELSRILIVQSIQAREALLRQIEVSRKTIERSLRLIARIDEAPLRSEKK
jgi:hypothetical protein